MVAAYVQLVRQNCDRYAHLPVYSVPVPYSRKRNQQKASAAALGSASPDGLGRLYGSSFVLPYGSLPLRRTWPVSFCPKAEFSFLHQVRHLHHSLPGSLLRHSLTGGGRKNESFT